MDENEFARRLLALLRRNPNINIAEHFKNDPDFQEFSRITQFRHYRADEQAREILKLVIPALIAELEIVVPALILRKSITGQLLYRKIKKDLFATLSIIYATYEENVSAECACTQYWQRVGNRCYPICNGENLPGSDVYSSLDACLMAQEPDWPDYPGGGQDGNGGYWITYIAWEPHTGLPDDSLGSSGSFYPNEAPGCISGNQFRWTYTLPRTIYDVNPSLWPSPSSSDSGFVYFSVPGFAKVAGYPWFWVFVAEALFADSDISIDGWFLGYAQVSIFDPGLGVPYVGEGAPGGPWLHFYFGELKSIQLSQVLFNGYQGFASKYVRSGSQPSPPSSYTSIYGSTNITGNWSLLTWNGGDQCSPFSNTNDPDDTCLDPGKGNTPISCAYPRDKRAYKIWVGGSKQTPVELTKIHYTDYSNYFGHGVRVNVVVSNVQKDLVNNGLISSEIVRIFSGGQSGQEWCKIESLIIEGQTIKQRTITKNPVAAPQIPRDWKQTTAIYNPSAPNSLPTSVNPTNFPAINANRTNKFVNIESVFNPEIKVTNRFLVTTDLQQRVHYPNSGFETNLESAIKARSLDYETIACIKPFIGNTANTEMGKGWRIEKVYQIHSTAEIIDTSAWINQVDKAYIASQFSCVILLLALACNKVLQVIGNAGLVRIKVKPGASFTGFGKVEVWRLDTEYMNPQNRTWVTELPSSNYEFEITLPWSDGDRNGLFFVTKNPAQPTNLYNQHDTCVISYDNQSMTVTLEGF